MKFVAAALVSFLAACSTSKDYYFLKKPVKPGARIAVLVQGKNEIKNAVFVEFMNAGYEVKAVNAADFYTTDDVFDIKDFKKIAFVSSVRDKNSRVKAETLDRMFDNAYKLHIYNFENSKNEIISVMKDKWKIDYVILVAMEDWQKGYSWARAIDLSNYELIYVHNYAASRADSYQSILRQMISTLQSAPAGRPAP